jgi:hypothetical protein
LKKGFGIRHLSRGPEAFISGPYLALYKTLQTPLGRVDEGLGTKVLEEYCLAPPDDAQVSVAKHEALVRSSIFFLYFPRHMLADTQALSPAQACAFKTALASSENLWQGRNAFQHF